MSLIGLLEPSGSMTSGKVFVSGVDLVQDFAKAGQTDVKSVIEELSKGDTGEDTVVVVITDGMEVDK